MSRLAWLQVRVLWFDDYYDHGVDENGKVVFETQQSLRVSARAMGNAAALVSAEHGEDGYRQEWFLYPSSGEALVRVQELLASE
jgi:hypothetical protein